MFFVILITLKLYTMKKTLTILTVLIIVLNTYAQQASKQFQFIPEKIIKSNKSVNCDIAVNPLHFFDDGGIYTLLPSCEVSKFNNFKATTFNIGMDNVTQCRFMNYLTQNNS